MKITNLMRRKIEDGRMVVLEVPKSWEEISFGMMGYVENILQLLDLDSSIVFKAALDKKKIKVNGS